MKTVEDAVRQENGVWDDGDYNAMAWLLGYIDYCSIVDGVLSYNSCAEPFCEMSSDWKLVCTREQFEEKAKEMGYTIPNETTLKAMNEDVGSAGYESVDEMFDDVLKDEVKPQSWVLCGDEKCWYVGNDIDGDPVVDWGDRVDAYDIKDLKPYTDPKESIKTYLQENDWPVTEGNIDLVERMVEAGKIDL